MNILVIEDDDLQGEWLCDELEKEFSRRPRWLATEKEFRDQLDAIAASPPDVAVIDVMLRWTTPSRNMAPRPPDAHDVYEAGLRCKKRLAEREATRAVPVILYTVLDREDLDAGLKILLGEVTYLQKDSDPQPLFRLINEVVGDQAHR